MASLPAVRVEDVLDNARQPLLIIDGQSRVLAANASFCKAFQLPHAQVVGHLLYELGAGVWDSPALRTLIDETLPVRHSVQDVEIDQEFGPAGRRIVLLNAREVRPDAGGPRLILLALEDVTFRRASERIVQHATAELRRSNRELQEFASVASHDLQEPLRKVQAFGDLLQRQLGDRLDDDSRDTLTRMRNAATRMSVLITDLLTYARLGHVRPALGAIRLGDVLGDVLADLDSRIVAAGARIEIGEMPALMADRGQMRQLFTNLLANALKFRRPGVPPVIAIEAIRQDSSHWAISVTDNGLGFEQQYAERMFGMFQRLHGTTHEGTGVGLALCRRIIEQHGGTVRAEGRPGEGARFTMVFPREAV